MKIFLLLSILVSMDVHARCSPTIDGSVSIVFLGNSITRHPRAPEVGWDNDWGMAASAQDSDFVSRVRSHYTARFSKVRSVTISIIGLEKNSESSEKTLEKISIHRPDILVIQGGDNIGKSISDKLRFIQQYNALLSGFREAYGNCARVVCVGPWFSAGTDLDQMKACQQNDGRFISLGRASGDPSMNASESFPRASSGVRAHPNDSGMEFISKAVLEALSGN